MPNILVVTPTGEARLPNAPAPALVCRLQAAGHVVVCLEIAGEAESLDTLFGIFNGRPPDILLVDLSTASGSLPLLYVRRLLRQVWGGDAPPPACLCLFTPAHLSQTDWTPHADDFLLPPYTPAELLSRIAMLRYRRGHVPADNLLRFADVVLDLDGKRVLDPAQRPLPLTPREYDLLEFLVTHKGKFFGRDRLLDLVWGIHFEGGERTVDIHIRRLRAKLPPQTAARLQTRRGMGYGLET